MRSVLATPEMSDRQSRGRHSASARLANQDLRRTLYANLIPHKTIHSKRPFVRIPY